MATSRRNLENLIEQLGYSGTDGLVWSNESPESGSRRVVVARVQKLLKNVDAVYFAGDTPIVYFATARSFGREGLFALHRRVWNDSTVPLLVAVDDANIHVFDAWAEPAREVSEVEDRRRLIRKLDAAANILGAVPELHRTCIDTGTYASRLPGYFEPRSRCDSTLIANLEVTRARLVAKGLTDEVAQLVLLRSILLLHLEHRSVIPAAFYRKFDRTASGLIDVLRDRRAAYAMFEELAGRFNGDLLPVHKRESSVQQHHLDLLHRFFAGKEEIASGQLALWPMYDFGVIPIQLLSAVYERLLHSTDADAARETGAFYTPYALVELLLNEVLPWPAKGARPKSELPRVIDPSCGSGVFLVEAYRRLIAQRHGGIPPKADARELADVMLNCIHGVDQQSLAVRIAAFSLYLAMLDFLAPGDIWGKLKFPRLTEERGARGEPPNLAIGDAFELEPRWKQRFTLVLGNPPWRRGKLPVSAKKWCAAHKLPTAGEIAQAFLWLAGELASDGRIAMLAPSKLLFNRELPDVEFRREFLRRFSVETVLNLSALRRGAGTQLFANAIGPAAGLVCRVGGAERRSPSIVYCTPRPGSRHHIPTALLIDAADVKFLPRNDAEGNDDIWKIMSAGTWRDLRLVRDVTSDGEPLREFISGRKGWKAARGFQPWLADSRAVRPREKKRAPTLSKLPFVHPKYVEHFVLPGVSDFPAWPDDAFNWTGPLEIYDAPHVLVKEGLRGGRFCAAFSSEACTFQDSVTGIHAPERDMRVLKALAAYLNSTFATYYLFLTSSTWGVERPRVKIKEALSLPSTPLRSEETVRKLAELIDGYTRAPSLRERQSVEAEINEAVFHCFGLSRSERALVEDITTVAVEHHEKGVSSVALAPPSTSQLREYAQAFASVWEQMLRGKQVSAQVYGGASPLLVASFYIRKDGSAGRERTVVMPGDSELARVLKSLDELLSAREGVNLFRRRHARVFEKDAVHVVKPAEMRFWTRSAAFEDADASLAQALNGMANGAR